MSTSPWTIVEVSRPSLVARVADYVELTKPKIALLELATVAIAAQVAALGAPDPWALGWALVGTALVAASASAWNQWLERSLDARMRRTADRPLPAGRLSPREAAWFGSLTGLAASNAAAAWFIEHFAKLRLGEVAEHAYRDWAKQRADELEVFLREHFAEALTQEWRSNLRQLETIPIDRCLQACESIERRMSARRDDGRWEAAPVSQSAEDWKS